MTTKIFNRLLAILSFAISIIASTLLLATFSWSALAQTATPSVPAASTPLTPHLRNTFNHLNTGFPLKAAHLSVACETCHIGGTFKGTPKDCAGCHAVGRLIAATPKTQNHIPTTKACDACHGNAASFQTAVMDHTGLTEPCAVCHNGSYSTIIKSVPSDSVHNNVAAPCDACHKNTFTFVGSKYDHTNAISDCVNCHNGVTAPGKPTAHIVTSQPCENCHTPVITPGWPSPTSFLGATFDHSTIAGAACSSCHGPMPGIMAKPATHIPTAAACETCHSPTSTSVGGFKAPNWAMSHTGITTGCASCHGGQSFQGATVVAKPATHIATTAACETCHSSSSTSIGGFAAPNWTMSHSGITTGCASCHGGQTFSTGVTPVGQISGHVSTTAACENCHTSTATPGGFATWKMSHTGITTGCANCHLTSGDQTVGNSTVKGEPAGHIVVTAACESCHTTTTLGGFATWTMNHAANGNTTGCATCHDNGKSFTNAPTLVTFSPSAHVPVTGVACESCHAPASTSTGAFATAWTMGTTGHALVTGTTCATCHDTGTTFTGVRTKSGSHITTVAPCSDCHTSTNTNGYTTFLNAQFDHGTTGALCSTCHSGSIAGIKTKTANHILTTQECNVCHTAPAHVAPVNGFNLPNPAMDHTGITTGCASCHNGANVGTSVTTTVLGKPATHIATTAACETCHTTAPTGNGPIGGFATDWASMNHTGITANCASCHTGATVGTTVVKGKPAGAAHIATTAACETCHTTTTSGGFATWTMNHTSIPSNCASCHLQTGDSTMTNPGATVVKGKPQGAAHIATTAACENCHTTTTPGGFATWTMNHTGITSNCVSCHTGATVGTTVVMGKPAGAHISTAAACESCHSATSTNTGGFAAPGWTMGTTGHTAIPSMPPAPGTRCDSCHNGQAFQGVAMVTSTSVINPHPGGALGGQDCGACHGSVTSFIASTTYTHVGATGICISCHATPGALLPGLNKPAGHLATSAQCDTCHTNGNFNPGGFVMTVSHAALGSNAVFGSHRCASSCHNDAANIATKGAPLPGASHIPTTINGPACDTCHTNQTSFTAWTMNHTGITSGCATCHAASYSGVVIKPGTHISTTAACETCHSATSTGTGGFAAPNWTMSHTGIMTGCSNCHNGQTFQGSVPNPPVTKPSYHIPTTASPACETCHTTTTTPGGFATWTMRHTGITTGCASCHTGATFGTTVVMGKPANHITTAATCETCHSTTNTSTGGFASPNPAMSHTGIAAGCASCHNGANVGTTVTTTVLGKPATHIATSAACETCHTNTTTPGGFATWTMSHVGITSGCASCHANGSTFYNVPSLVTLSLSSHVPVGALSCESCHNSASTSTGAFSSAWTMGTTGHALVNATPCATCHNDGTPYTGVTKKNSIISHLVTTAACDTCHTSSNTSGYTTFLGATGAHTTNPVPTLGATCSGCHGTTIVATGPGGGKGMVANHIPIGGRDCSACHTWSSFTVWTAPAVHTAVTGTACSTCHAAGLSYAGVVTKSAATTHITTALECSVCHTSTVSPGGFSTWTMNHAANGNTSACATCHAAAATSFTNNGGTPMVKLSTTNHVPVGATACELCHASGTTNTGGFATSALPFTTNHSLVSTTCGTCHGTAGSAFTGVKIIDGAHIPSGYYSVQDCGTYCHTVASTSNYSVGGFLLLNMQANVASHNGTGVAPNCANCHNNVIAKGKASLAGHVVTAADCVTCHTQSNTGNYSSFLGATAGHDVTPAGQTAALHNCVSCHTGAGTGLHMTTPPHIPSGTMQCDYCHTTSYTSLSFLTQTMSHTFSGTAVTVCSTCHNGSYTSQGTTGAQTTTFIANHIPTAIIGAAVATTSTCNTCHSGTTNWTTMTSSAAIHNGAQGGGPVYCVTCHLSSATYMEPSGFQKVSHNGASTAKDCSISGCHKPRGSKGTAYSSWN